MPSSTMKKPNLRKRLEKILADPANAEKGHVEIAKLVGHGCKESMVRRFRAGLEPEPKTKPSRPGGAWTQPEPEPEPKAEAAKESAPKWKPKRRELVEIAKLHLDMGTQMRERIDQHTVEHYRELRNEGVKFPPVDVFTDGKMQILGHGFHRVLSAKLNGETHIEANIYEGDIRAAMLFAVGANADNPLARNIEAKKRAMACLLSDPEWTKWSVNKLRLAAGVSFEFADKFKKDWDARHGGGADDGVRTVERNGVTYEMDTKAIGKGKRTGLVEERDPGEDDADDLPKPANDQANSAVEEKTFLDSLPLYKALKGSAHTVFVEDALLFYRTEEGRTQLENFYRRHIRKTHAAEQGRYRLALESFLKTKHPRFWVRCLQCEGTGAISNKCCQSCGGRGYSVPGLPAVSA